jgi:hypothetical protein
MSLVESDAHMFESGKHSQWAGIRILRHTTHWNWLTQSVLAECASASYVHFADGNRNSFHYSWIFVNNDSCRHQLRNNYQKSEKIRLSFAVRNLSPKFRAFTSKHIVCVFQRIVDSARVWLELSCGSLNIELFPSFYLDWEHNRNV